MNSGQWAELLRATKGHTPGPWAVSEVRNADIIADDSVLWYEGWANDGDITLTAAAPDLLEEVRRLREWIEYISDNPRGGHATYTHAQDALFGAEVPE